MKCFILLLALVAVAYSDFTADEEQEWLEFKQEHAKMFLSPGKELQRKQAFLKNSKAAKAHNARHENGEVTWHQRLNQYSDLTPEQFKARFHGAKKPADARAMGPNTNPDSRAGNAYPLTLDLSAKPSSWPVRDQKQCGSCWTFSTGAAVEFANWAKHGGQIVELSEQQLVDCVTASSGCDGGWMPDAMDYIAANGGIVAASSYPYTAVDGTCKGTTVSPKIVKLSSYTQISSDDASIKTALYNQGVLSICVDAELWQNYGGGIFNDANYKTPNCDHAVALVGYGNDTKGPYWKIRNSWNTGWGENGYIRVSALRDSRNRNKGGYFTQYSYFPNVV